ncbi:MAG: hypothetical protein WDM81_13530 [Rhizomicrobium sp.]
MAPAEVAIPGVDTKQPVFRVRAALAEQSVRAYGQPVPLQPGMLLSATSCSTGARCSNGCSTRSMRRGSE